MLAKKTELIVTKQQEHNTSGGTVDNCKDKNFEAFL